MPEPLSIIHVLARFGFGGAETNTVRLVNALAKRGHRQAVVCMSKLVDESMLDMLSVDLIRSDDDLSFPRGARFLSRLIKRHHAQVLHGRGYVTWLDCWAAQKLTKGTKHVQSFHGPNTFEEHVTKRKLTAWCLQQSTDALLGVSQDLASRITRQWRVPAERVHMIPNGVKAGNTPDVNRAAAKKYLGFEPDSFVIGSIGSLFAVKNRGFLINAFSELSRGMQDSYLLLIGDGPMRQALEDQVQQLGLTSRVRFYGYQSEVQPFLAAMDVFVQSSLKEGSPTAVMEAMSARVPVISSRAAGCVEISEAHGLPLLVDHNDVSGLSNLLASLSQDPQRLSSLAKNGQEIVNAHFTFEGMVDRYEQLYADLASHGQRSLQDAAEVV